MSISVVMSQGMLGIQAGINRSGVASGKIASSNVDTENLASSMVDLRSSEIQVKASADLVKVGDQLLGTLIDIHA